jgi:signal transduction histidine kinase/CRP-like cAMP-binding protein
MKEIEDSLFINKNKELVEYLKKSRLFIHLPEKQLNQIAKFSEFVDYSAGTEILKEGEPNQKIFLLISGNVSVYSGDELILKLNRKGDIIGEMSVISNKPTSATVLAETQVRLFSIQADDIGKYTDIDAKTLQNTLYHIFAMILTEKLATTTLKAKQYEIVNRQLSHRIDLEKLISKISSLFIDVSFENIWETVNQSIKMIGEFYRYQRCLLFLLSNIKTNDKTIFEWCSDGKNSWLEPFQKHLKEMLLNFSLAVEKSVGNFSPSIIDIPPDVIKDMSIDKESKSLFIIPLLIKKKLIGFIVSTPAPPEVDVQREDLAMIGVVGEMILNVLERRRTGEKLQQAYMAGMAENAVSVLHHIGNAITPAMTRIDDLQGTKTVHSIIKYLDKIQHSLDEHLQSGDLTVFLKENEKGRNIMPFFLKLIYELKENESRYRQSLQIIDHQIQKISKIISLQQKYTSFENYKESFYLSTIINDVLEMMHPVLSNNKINIVKKIDPTLPPLTLEKSKLVHVLLNLLKNAVESIDDQMDKTPQMKPIIEIQAYWYDSEKIAVFFKDSGVGISSEELSHVFEFGYTTKTKGSGFGLHDCLNFIHFIKGELKLTSPGPGLGATVEIIFPDTTSEEIKK